MLALLQTFVHLYYDYDRVFRPMSQETGAADQRPRVVGRPMAQLQASAPFLLQRVVFRSVIMNMVAPFAYTLFLRGTAWNWMLSFARIFWEMPAAAELSFIPPYHISLLARSLVSSFFLILLWESSNTIFGAFIAQEPLKRGMPLTNESNDPNGTLLNGLKSKKEVVKVGISGISHSLIANLSQTFAFWELVHISQRFETRRKSMFADIDRPSGPIWNQILAAGLHIIQGMNARVAEFENPTLKSPPRPQPDVQSLPRLAAPLKQDHVLRTPAPPSNRLEKIESRFSSMAKSYGQTPPSPRPTSASISPRAKKYLSVARNKLLTPNQQQTLTPSNFQALFHHYLLRCLNSAAGVPFRQTFTRRVGAIVFGSPHSSFGQVLDAINALSHLALASLTEDDFGKVSPDVPGLIRTYLSTITTLEGFVQGMQPHWTDIEGIRERRVEEVDAVLVALREGLKILAEGFGPFASALGMTEKEMAIVGRVAGVDNIAEGEEGGG